jgi:hypothetical protein
MRTRDEENDAPTADEREAADPAVEQVPSPNLVAGLGFEWGPYDRPLPSEVNQSGVDQPETE